ncbi:DUF1450 domain-containing protein [Bacillaceae bacterium W0354]
MGGLVVVEYCDGNLIQEVDLEAILEEEYPEVAVLENSCLSFCGMCSVSPYAIVNGKRVFAKTPEECLDKIRKQIEEELEIYKEA